MATLAEVQAALDSTHPGNGVIVADEHFRTLAWRPPAEGGGAVLIVLGDPFPDLHRSYRPKRGDEAGRS